MSKFAGIRAITVSLTRLWTKRRVPCTANKLNSKKRIGIRRCWGGQRGGGSHWPSLSTSFHLLNLHFFRWGGWRKRKSVAEQGMKEGTLPSPSPSFIQIFSTRNIHFLRPSPIPVLPFFLSFSRFFGGRYRGKESAASTQRRRQRCASLCPFVPACIYVYIRLFSPHFKLFSFLWPFFFYFSFSSFSLSIFSPFCIFIKSRLLPRTLRIID